MNAFEMTKTERIEFLKRYNIDISKLDPEYIKSNIDNLPEYLLDVEINNYNIRVRWLPDYYGGSYEATLIYKDRCSKIILSNYSLLVRIIITPWLECFIKPQRHEAFSKHSNLLRLEYKRKIYTFDRHELICIDKENGKDLFRKKISKDEILGMENSPANNGILIFSKIHYDYEKKEADDIPGKRTSSVRLVDENGDDIWLAEREDAEDYLDDTPPTSFGFYQSFEIYNNKIMARNQLSSVILDPYTGKIITRGPSR